VNEQNMTVAERRLSDGLDALAETEAPAATVTVAEVISSGKQALRRRRSRGALALSAALVVVAGVAIGVPAAIGGGSGTTSAAPAHHIPVPMGAVTLNVSPPVEFGYLPASLNGEYEVSYGATGPNYKGKIDPSTNLPPFDGPGGYGVQVWAPGDVILSAGLTGAGSGTDPSLKFTASAGTVQGHQAWWTLGAPGSHSAAAAGNLELMWQYEPGAWAMVLYHGNTGAVSGPMLLQVADGLVIGEQNPVQLPFGYTLPGSMHVDAVQADLPKQHGAQVGAAAVRVCTKSPCADGGLVISQDSATWQNNSTLVNYDAPKANPGTKYTTVTVAGHTAQLRTTSTAATLTFGYDGTNVTVAASGAEYTALGGRDGFLSFSRSLTWYGADPAHWTSGIGG
jgi:hypothetical protein